MDECKLAKALGFDIICNEINGVWVQIGRQGKEPVGHHVPLANFEVWLNSPAGEKAVRDRVRELCPNGSSICYVYFPDLPLGHRLGIDIPGCPEFDCATEAEAFAALALWLADMSIPTDCPDCKGKLEMVSQHDAGYCMRCNKCGRYFTDSELAERGG